MAEAAAPSPSLPENSLAQLRDHLEQQVLSEMKATTQSLQEAHQEGSLELETLKKASDELLSLSKTCLLLRVVPSLFSPPLEVSLSTEEMLKALEQAAETLKAISQESLLQAIDPKAEKVRQLIQAKEQSIREGILQKQKHITQKIQALKN